MNPILIDLPMPITTPRLLIRPPRLGDGIVVNAAIIESNELFIQLRNSTMSDQIRGSRVNPERLLPLNQ